MGEKIHGGEIMIKTRFGSDIEILFGDMETGDALVQYVEDGELLCIKTSLMIADGGLREVEAAIIESRKHAISAKLNIIRVWHKWFEALPAMYRVTAMNTGLTMRVAETDSLQNWLDWVSRLDPTQRETTFIKARCGHLISLSRSALSAGEVGAHA
jgi:hypothetical protein